ncbi:MAG: oxygen-independent coproporphyrinogen III oxidase-like protein [Neisseriaceae bacterium]|nr:MAG: oxygen-independent coproporphyrinogen III oxidase-like protein [Neisseriaceae bacterium]
MSSLNLTQLPPLSLYIHMPWCIKKCPYCDFNSHGLKGTLPEQEYIDSLIIDLEQSLPLVWGRSIQTIFIGGGTPSLFSGEAIDRLISSIRSRIKISPYAEITLEANPGTVEKHYIAEYATAGVNRISLGIQSFNDQHLKILGRIHSADEACKAIETVANNFANFNLDIIYGLPKQTIEQAIDDIQHAINAKPTHISAYNLTIEPNTHFAKFIPKHMPEDDVCYQMQDAIINTLASNGYKRYEISAFAKNNLQSQHNRNYWEFGDYLGIGAGAHSKLSFHDRIIRQMRHKHPSQYMERVKVQQHIDEDRIVTSQELPFEFMMNALRLCNGFTNTLFAQTTGQSFNSILPQLLEAQEQGFIELGYNKVTPTTKGCDFLNNLLELFL